MKTDDFIVELETKRVTIPSHGEKRHEYIFYIGPKEQEALNQCDEPFGNLRKRLWSDEADMQGTCGYIKCNL